MENYTEEEFLEEIKQYALPSLGNIILIVFIFGALLLIGLIGNLLIVFVVIVNQSMRTTTNIFLGNLAVADFMVILFCLPSTILWDISKTWWFSDEFCRATFYLQQTSVTVSMLTMVAISIERWFAIARPLKFIASPEWTAKILVLIWIAGFLFSAPQLLLNELKPFDYSNVSNPTPPANFTSTWFSSCDTTNLTYSQYYWLANFILLFFTPLSIIGVMYGMIAYLLWMKSGGNPVPASAARPSQQRDSEHAITDMNNRTDDRRFSTMSTTVSKPTPCVIRSHCGGIPGQTRNSNRHIDGRRKAAKMLICVVILFVICYGPVFAQLVLTVWGIVPDLTVEWMRYSFRFLFYLNCCVNPILYNFMSEKFQREFRKACCCVKRAPELEYRQRSVHQRAVPHTHAQKRTATRLNVCVEEDEGTRLVEQPAPSGEHNPILTSKHNSTHATSQH